MKTQIASTDPPTMTEIQGYEYQINLESDDFKNVTSKSDQKFFGWFLSPTDRPIDCNRLKSKVLSG